MNAVVMLLALKLVFVERITESDSEAVIQFEGGMIQGRLPKDDKAYLEQLGYAQKSLKDHCPVALTMVKANRIVVVEPADSVTVKSLKDSDGAGLRVRFRGRAAACFVRKDHPDFHRLRALLEESAKDHSRIWVSFQKQERLIVDAVPESLPHEHLNP